MDLIIVDFERIYALHKFFSIRRYPVPLNVILNEFDFSKNTFNIARNYLCNVFGAPLKICKGQGYFYDLKSNEIYELPGLWFSAKEIISLALLEQLSETLQPEVVKQLLHPVSERLHQLLVKQNISQHDWQNRIKVASQWQRVCEPEHFIDVSHALLKRQQLEIDYWQWQTDMIESRIISPQRLVYYRDNWYLDAWCHNRQALRTFSLDAICQTKQTHDTAYDIDTEQLNAHVMTGYGIFAGQVTGIAHSNFPKPSPNAPAEKTGTPTNKVTGPNTANTCYRFRTATPANSSVTFCALAVISKCWVQSPCVEKSKMNLKK